VHALYIHFPFCFHKCHYCDFYSITRGHDQPAEHRRWALAVQNELAAYQDQFQIQPSSIFIGGGTPTLLSPDAWDTLLDSLQIFELNNSCTEFTVEANPETVTPDQLQRFAAGGVNRLSIGAQSFQKPLLETLERWHEPANVARAVSNARAAGIFNISLDLIFSIPGQSESQLNDDLDQALDLGPEHLSVYSLIFEPHTPLEQRRVMGQVQPTDPDREAAMYRLVIDRLAEAGYEQYEVSNWARRSDTADYRCRHNLAYWRNENWLGVGPSAASHVAGVRWKNQPHLGRYLATSPDPAVQDVEQLDADARAGETLMLGLRLRSGLPAGRVAALAPPGSGRAEQIHRFTDAGLLETVDGHLRLTDRGLMVGDAVLAELL